MARLTVSAVPVLNDNYVWMIHNAETGETAAVDPSVAEPVLSAAASSGMRITQVLNTHWHPDHTGGNGAIKAATGSPVIAPAEARKVSEVDHVVAEGDRVTIAGAEAVVWDIPAHTAGHIAYYFEDEGMIFVGDTMFAMGCGRLFEGTAEQMWTSLSRIAALPADTTVYSAHEYTLSNGRFAVTVDDSAAVAERTARVAEARAAGRWTVPTTIAEERATNPFLRAPGLPLGQGAASPAEAFGRVRAAKDAYRG